MNLYELHVLQSLADLRAIGWYAVVLLSGVLCVQLATLLVLKRRG